MVGRKRDILRLMLAIAGIIILNLVLSSSFFRIDFTAEKRFTLSAITKKTLGSLDDKLDIIVYLEGDFPAGFKRLRNATQDALNDFKAYSNGRLAFDFVNPTKGSENARQNRYQTLSSQGIEPMQVNVPKEGGFTQILVYPAAVITYKGKQIAVSLLPSKSGALNQANLNAAAENLEYTIISGIKKIMAEGKPLVGITEGHGELSDIQLYDAMSTLSDGFDVRRVNLNDASFEGLDRMKLLIIAKPLTAFSEAEKYKIDYFVTRGGRVIWSIDNVDAELDSLRTTGSGITNPRKLGLDDLLFNYGARINYELIADMHCAPIPIQDGQGQMQLLPWLYYPVFVSQSKHPLVRNLDGVRSEFANTVDTVAAKGVNKQVILSSSPYSRIALSPATISLSMLRNEADPRAFKDKELPVAVLLEGRFTSAFAGRPLPAGIPWAGNASAAIENKMVVIGDGDIFKNQVNAGDGSPYPLGYDRYSQEQYGNRTFLLNIADYLTDDSGLIELRNKEINLRLLDRPRIRENKVFWQAFNLILPLLIVGVAGSVQYFHRRSKFAGKIS